MPRAPARRSSAAEVSPAAGAEAGERRDLRAALAAAERRLARGRPQHLVELDEPPVELDQLETALADELLVEAVVPEHLEDQAAEVADRLLAQVEQRTPLAAQRAGRGEGGAR